MKLGEFIKNFSHNNIIRLVHKDIIGYKTVLEDWNHVSMDHQILKGKSENRHYINNEVLGLTSICVKGHYPEALNIIIEELENQPFIPETPEEEMLPQSESI